MSEELEVYIVPGSKGRLPERATNNSACWDLYAAEKAILYPGKLEYISTGLILKAPPGYHIKIFARSGLGTKYGITLPHSVGIIDQDYCGPTDIVKVPLYMLVGEHHRDNNTVHTAAGVYYSHDVPDSYNRDKFIINIGDRIAQMSLEKTSDFNIKLITQDQLQNNRGGFGSTGIHNS